MKKKRVQKNHCLDCHFCFYFSGDTSDGHCRADSRDSVLGGGHLAADVEEDVFMQRDHRR